jgi:hypothetical protein
MTDLTIIARPGSEHQVSHQAALAMGARAHGMRVIEQSDIVHVRTEHAACWGWRMGRQLRDRGHEVLVMERGYLGDRFAWTSLGWNGLNGRAAFATRNDGGERFRQHFGSRLKPWNPEGRYVLLIGQVPGDMSLQGRDLAPWYAEQAERARNLYRLPVMFRPHPLAVSRGLDGQVPMTQTLQGDLQESLANAEVVITFNSNTGVDALLAGKPTISHDRGSMVWGLANGGFAEPARERWFGRLAWFQWTLDEIRNGTAVAAAFSLNDREAAA